LLAEKKSPEEVLEELYVRTLCRKPTAAEVKKLTDIVRRETSDPKRVQEMVRLQLGLDPLFKRNEERLQKLKDDLSKLPNNSKEALVLDKQIKTLEQQQNAILQRYQASAVQIVYGDILWGLFNSTEFTFNH